jgi:hypothetical protein
VTAFVRWLLRHRYRLIVVAIAVAPMIPFAAAALMTLETIRRGPRQGLMTAAISAAGVVLLGMAVGGDLYGVGVVGLFLGTMLGGIMAVTHSLMLAFQAIWLLCVAGLLAALATWPDPLVLIGPYFDNAMQIFRDNGAAPEQIAALSGLGTIFFGLAAAFAFVQLVVAALLGYWWACLGGTPGAPGKDFRALKLGKIIGVPATLVMAISWFVDATLVQNLFPLVLFGFCLQGLAVTHAWAHAKRWNPALLLVMYLMLVSPLTVVVVFALGSMGLTDNWVNLRAPLRAAR